MSGVDNKGTISASPDRETSETNSSFPKQYQTSLPVECFRFWFFFFKVKMDPGKGGNAPNSGEEGSQHEIKYIYSSNGVT